MTHDDKQGAEDTSDSALNIGDLIAAFPQCLFFNHVRRRPLKIGILADLMPLVPFGVAKPLAGLRGRAPTVPA